VEAPHIPSVPAVSAAELLRGAFEHQNGCTVFGRAERCAKGSIAASDHRNIRRRNCLKPLLLQIRAYAIRRAVLLDFRFR
jgi:hypothetical protein